MKREQGNSTIDINNVLLTTIVIIVIAGLMFLLPLWNVWRAKLSGEAALKRAEQTKMIMIETARAEKESATFRAEAIKIMGEAAKNFPEYRQQEFMQAFGEALREGNISQIIYVPTESNIPILEANRLQKSLDLSVTP